MNQKPCCNLWIQILNLKTLKTSHNPYPSTKTPNLTLSLTILLILIISFIWFKSLNLELKIHNLTHETKRIDS